MYRRAFARGDVKDGLRAFSLVKKYFRHILDGFCKGRGGGGGGGGVFGGDKKYFRHVSEGFCKRSKGGLEEFWRGYEAFTRVGVWKSLWAFAWVIKYHKHIWEGFCKTRTRALSQGLQII